MIPRVFHQIWVGTAPFPDEFRSYQESWLRHHPGWELRLWGEGDLPANLRRPEAYDQARTPAERSDIIRLDLLWQYGGIYLDADFECRKQIEPLLDGVEFFTAYLKPGGRVNNAIIGSVPGHPLLDRALDELRGQNLDAPFDKTASGPLFFASLIEDFPQVTIFDAEQFYPSTPEQRERAYAVHHSARSWKDEEGWKQAALRAEERLDKTRRKLEKERQAHEKTRKALDELKRAAKRPVEKPKHERDADTPGRTDAEGAGAGEDERRGALPFLRPRK